MAKAAKTKATDFPPKETSKSQRVRDYRKTHRGAKPAEIVEALKGFGVNKNDVANVIYAKPKKGKGGRKAKIAARGGSEGAGVDRNGSATDSLGAALALLEATGGITEAKAVLDRLAGFKKYL